MLRKLYESFPGVHDVIVSNTLTRFRIDVANLPSREDTDSAAPYRAPLCRDYGCTFHALMARSYTAEGDREDGAEGGSIVGNANEIEEVAMAEANGTTPNGENPVASSSSSGYTRSSSSDSMPELVRGGPHGLHSVDVSSAPGTHWTRHALGDDPSGRNRHKVFSKALLRRVHQPG